MIRGLPLQVFLVSSGDSLLARSPEASSASTGRLNIHDSPWRSRRLLRHSKHAKQARYERSQSTQSDLPRSTFATRFQRPASFDQSHQLLLYPRTRDPLLRNAGHPSAAALSDASLEPYNKNTKTTCSGNRLSSYLDRSAPRLTIFFHTRELLALFNWILLRTLRLQL
jgi:hypothetical protein